jgi:CO/xanthine dehydrogenase FAD-binding subunit
VKPPRFEYFAPETLDEALALLAERGEDAKVLAGGQSLVPLLNFRLVRPRALVDVNALGDLAYVRADDGVVAVGALARQRDLERSAVARERCPLVAAALPHVGHAAIRNRGTVAGSIVHADPAAELPAVLAALGGSVVARSRRGTRTIAARDLFVTYLTTALEPDELLVEVRLPALPAGAGVSFHEVSRRHGDFALVAAAAAVTLGRDGVCEGAWLALAGVGATPFAAADEVAPLRGERVGDAAIREVARRVRERVRPDGDLHASREYRTHVAGVLVERSLRDAAARAGGGGTPAGAGRDDVVTRPSPGHGAAR